MRVAKSVKQQRTTTLQPLSHALPENVMTTRIEARKKGLRMAAHLAAITGVMAGAVAAAQGAPASTGGAQTAVGASQTESQTTETAGSDNGVSALSNLLRTNARGGNCGCAPCWGPPAPPQMSGQVLSVGEEQVS